MKHIIIVISILLCANFLFSCEGSDNIFNRLYYGQRILLLDPNEFGSYMDSIPDAIVLDVRTPKEFDEEHIADAINLNYYDPNFSNMLTNIDTSSTILLYCRSGRRSNDADILMKSKGYKKVYQLEGGIKNWKRADKMIVK